MSAVPLVMCLDVAAIVIWHFKIALDQQIWTINIIRMLLGGEPNLVIVTTDGDRSGYAFRMELHEYKFVWKRQGSAGGLDTKRHCGS
jgi:hypothetical protein